MKNLRIIALYTMCSITVLSSCKKDKDNTPTPTPSQTSAATKTSLLINKNWKTTAYVSTPNDGVGGDFSQQPPCEQDDILTFSAESSTATSGTFLDDVKTKCEDDEVNINGKWAFNAAQNEITLTAGNESRSAKIETLTVSTLKISTSYTDETTKIVYTQTQTFTAQ